MGKFPPVCEEDGKRSFQLCLPLRSVNKIMYNSRLLKRFLGTGIAQLCPASCLISGKFEWRNERMQKFEYIWLDVNGEPRSKTRVIETPKKEKGEKTIKQNR